MYLEYWHLQEKPFENTPDTRFLFTSAQHQEALARLYYAVTEHKGTAMLSGVFGCGKTLISRALQDRLSQEQYRVAALHIPPRRYSDLFRGIVRSLRSVNLPMNESDLSFDAMLQLLEEALEENIREGRETIIIVDEAHAITSGEVFEGLRVLLNLHSQVGFKLTLILLGQPELVELIDTNKPFEQRISIKARLQPLSAEEATAYITHRLAVAGRQRPVFTQEAIDLIFQNTGGIPRRINRLCDMALLSGCVRRLPLLDRASVQEEIAALQGEV
jgi:type II secretory pathway predicted ATPase ExeA